MGKYKLTCSECGYKKNSYYLHDVCPKCKGSMHFHQEKSLYQAMLDQDKKTEKKIEKAMKRGEIVRLI